MPSGKQSPCVLHEGLVGRAKFSLSGRYFQAPKIAIGGPGEGQTDGAILNAIDLPSANPPSP